MKKRFFSFLVIALSIVGMPTARCEIITAANLGSINTPGGYYVINERVELPAGDTVRVGSRSVLRFNGGSFAGGCLDISDCYVQSASYCIFDGTDIMGHLANETVSPHWFGQIKDSDNAAVVINRALSLAPESKIVAGGIKYNISSPISLDRDGQRIFIPGRLGNINNGNRFALLEMNAENLFADVSKIDVSVSNMLTGAKMSGNTAYSRLNVGFAWSSDSLKQGICLTSAGGADCKMNNISFQMIKAVDALVLDGNEGNFGTDGAIRANRISGGRVMGGSGITEIQQVGPARPFKSNVFYCIGLEKLYKLPVSVTGSENERFEYLRMNESLPVNGPYIGIENVRNLKLMTKGSFHTNKVDVGAKVEHSIVETTFSDEFWFLHGFNRLFVHSDEAGNAQTYLGSSKTYPAFYKDITIDKQGETELVLTDLLAGASPDTYYMGRVAFIRVNAGQTVTLNLKKTGEGAGVNAENPLNIPLLLYVRLNGGEMKVISYPRMPPFTQSQWGTRNTAITESGLYLLTWSDEWAIELIKM